MSTIHQQPANAFYAPTLLPAIEELLARGITQGAIEAQLRRSLSDLRTPFMRMPLLMSRRFWGFAVEQSADPSIGLAAGRRFVSTATNGLTYLFDVAVSLQRACEFFAEYFAFFNGHFRVQILRENRGVTLRLLESGSLGAPAALTDYILVSLCSLVRRKLLASGVTGDPVLGVALASASREEHQSAFRAPVSAGQPWAAIHLDPQLFAMPLTPGNPALETTLIDVLEQTRRHSESTLLEQLSDYLIEDLATADWPQFCAAQHVLERTAARRLKALGWTFSELLDEYRRYRAEDLLQSGALELVEVADRLGYSDVQGFNRAFARWLGCAPGEYRARFNKG
ncbi:AraC family transcriptional regulator [Pseudomonas moraviensis subsp. stanleyae]|uniref:AraC family transcriptional regulator n=1 Tax=Pseudomonas moraviensis TaxID=321662 RepID=UPI002E33B7B4|nr:AraC family transcriptional regulator ligand-binding domain-containing protein [Pseudomonas moraviensis]MED7666602.1 AraC family transcriptional regulator [Pseudomonas moraviensis subsp. stanleyae]